ncbi:TIR domain-containing protein [Actinomadura rayongensis]|uniref:TIR domain-containing protein n=1 Tax=Actinomadura rayongensis TaxID=1429076 RepID=A0A6I4W689_9ACTN|nr:TIR domain-containing protein [Actinomadura rayongensis]
MSAPPRDAIFISFRSADPGSYAAVYLDEVLVRMFGPDRVFRSSRSIEPGADFRRVLEEGLARACVVLVVIGKGWAQAAGSAGEPMLWRPDDWVRREIGESLRAGIHVVPVLLTDAKLPSAAELPPDLADLASRQSVHLRHRHIVNDTRHLLDRLGAVAPALAARHLAPDPGPSDVAASMPSALLRPENEVVPFAGRGGELAELTRWRDGPRALSVALVTGPAGQGKSRLAREFAARSARDGWVAGSLSGQVPVAEVARLGESGLKLLAVVDYAEGEIARIHEIVSVLLARRGAPAPARLLLLARTAGTWLDELLLFPGDEGAAVLDARTHLSLDGLTHDTAAEFRRAAAIFAARLGLPAPDEAAVGRRFARPDFATSARPLDVHAAALAFVLEDHGAGGAERDPVIRLLHHERLYWRRAAGTFSLPDPYPDRLAATVAAATLFGGDRADDLRRVVAALPTFHDEPRHVVDRYLRWTAELFPPGPDAVESAPSALRPDRLGEEHVARTLRRQPDLLAACLPVLWTPQVERALTVLGRAAPRHEEIGGHLRAVLRADLTRYGSLALAVALRLESPGPLADALAAEVDALGDAALARWLAAGVPAHLPVFAHLHATVARMALDAPGGDALIRARLRRGNAAREAVRGRYAAALAEAIEAVRALRTLAGAGPEHWAELALALAILADCLDGTGHPAEALQAVREAVHLQMAVVGPQILVPADPRDAPADPPAGGAAAAVAEAGRGVGGRSGRHERTLVVYLRLLVPRALAAGDAAEADAARVRIVQLLTIQRLRAADRAHARDLAAGGDAADEIRSNVESSFADFPDEPGPETTVTELADAARHLGVRAYVLDDVPVDGAGGRASVVVIETVVTGPWAVYRDADGWVVGLPRTGDDGEVVGVAGVIAVLGPVDTAPGELLRKLLFPT